ncbi:hypothetical protein UPYG_G00244060 [Umbra pygmaea]|uniref:FHF complex subunit HOOK-interacting protein C-terminal domain-containing protein n=1 Tax=Umbra pygmaea TaxID=75934 RepID=A0ABD0WY73_UMBPY
MGPILELVVLEGVMERLFLWSLRRQFTDDMKLEQLRMYQMLLGQARQPLLHHKPVLRPLMMLLSSCAGAAGGGGGGAVEAELVLLLHQLCVALTKDPSVLELFFHTSEDQGAANFLLFSLLIPFTHRGGSVGQQARDALLLIMKLSASDPRVATHIADNTYFCPVLATGLSGLYSSLPAKLLVYSEDWYCLERADWIQVPALVQFLHSLEFCCSVIKVAHPSIRGQLLGYIYNGFLAPVLAPALHKCTLEEVMTTTAYLELFLRSVSEPALLQTFLSFLLQHTHDNVHILDTLVSRINTPFQLGTVSLSLFRTLIGLFCEDVMLQLVFRYLIPCTHLCVGKRQLVKDRDCYSSSLKDRDCYSSSLKDRDCYSSSAVSILQLTPSWCPLTSRATPTEHILWTEAADVSASDSDRVGYSRTYGSDFLIDANYLHYLWDARVGIAASRRACRVWSAPYDGENPQPEEEQEGEKKNATLTPSMSSPSPPPTPPSSISPAVKTGNQQRGGGDRCGRGSVMELEWDDSFEWDDGALVPSPAPPIDPPQHIQDMRKSAILLVQGSYIEESDFQDDVLVYNLIAQRDASESSTVASSTVDGHEHKVQRGEEAVAHRVKRSRLQPRAPQLSNGLRYDKHEVSEGVKGQRNSSEQHLDNNCRFNGDMNMAVSQAKVQNLNQADPTIPPTDRKQRYDNVTPADPTLTSVMTPVKTPVVGDDFVSEYRDLMWSLGVDPDDVTDDITEFKTRVLALMEREEEVEFNKLSAGTAEAEDADLKPENCREPGNGIETGISLETGNSLESKRSRDGKHGTPFTGPFISVLLSRLENLLDNPIPVNLLVTGILSQLAMYPQPLLRAFLFNTHSKSQPNVRTLYQVLDSVHSQIEHYSAARPEFPAMVREAWRYLLAKDQDLKHRELMLENHEETVPPNGFQQTHNIPPCPKIPPQCRSRVFAAVLYAEFLKELAAIAQEHSIEMESSMEDCRNEYLYL